MGQDSFVCSLFVICCCFLLCVEGIIWLGGDILTDTIALYRKTVVQDIIVFPICRKQAPMSTGKGDKIVRNLAVSVK